MSTFLSVHDVKQFAASTVWTSDNDCAAHLTLNFEGRVFDDHGAVTLYIDDAVLNTRLIEAINRIVAERKAELSSSEEQDAA